MPTCQAWGGWDQNISECHAYACSLNSIWHPHYMMPAWTGCRMKIMGQGLLHTNDFTTGARHAHHAANMHNERSSCPGWAALFIIAVSGESRYQNLPSGQWSTHMACQILDAALAAWRKGIIFIISDWAVKGHRGCEATPGNLPTSNSKPRTPDQMQLEKAILHHPSNAALSDNLIEFHRNISSYGESIIYRV